ncbi:23S rRNA (pseudouridine(1915)-N(3))-methyltransferase RlmH [Thermaurantiacus sp.]
MRITILAFGRAGDCEEARITARYLARLRPPPVLRELARLPLPKPAPGTRTILLDEHGEALTSAAIAARLQTLRAGGLRELRFVIGPADGLPPGIRASADETWAFGPQTWPHLLVRAMLAEQLYRAATIREGHPYHRDQAAPCPTSART